MTQEATYEVHVVGGFCAAHRLDGYPGSCARLHGHNWKVEVDAFTHVLDDIGMAFDFRELRRMLDAICEELDHRNLNDLPPFSSRNPTAENVAAYIYARLESELVVVAKERVTLRAVTIWENERSAIRYTRGRHAGA